MRKEHKTEINILIEMIPITKTTLSKSIGSVKYYIHGWSLIHGSVP